MFGKKLDRAALRQLIIRLAVAAARIASTSVIGMEASVAPKCICTGQLMLSFLVPAMPPPPYLQDAATRRSVRYYPKVNGVDAGAMQAAMLWVVNRRRVKTPRRTRPESRKSAV